MTISGYVQEDALVSVDVPFEGAFVDANVVDLCSCVQVTQFYYNSRSDEVIECSFKFPIVESSAICGLEHQVEGQGVVVGKVAERQKARTAYDTAVKRGDRSTLLERDKSGSADVLNVWIGNIPCNTRIRVTVSYVAELSYETSSSSLTTSDKTAKFIFPTSIMPRYTPQTLVTGTGINIWQKVVGDKSAWDEQRRKLLPLEAFSAERKSYPFAMVLDIQAPVSRTGSTISVTCPSREDSFKWCPLAPNTGCGLFDAELHDLQSDLVVEISTDAFNEPRATMEETVMEGEGVISTAIACTIIPHFVLDEVSAVEFIFLVDRSGSMVGKMRLVQDALQLFLKSLPVGCCFNIIGFGSSHNSLFPITNETSRTYNDQTLAEACEYVASMRADMGGTEIFKPLYLLAHHPTNIPRQTFVLTDGAVDNTDGVVMLVAETHRKTNGSRLFSIGIGPSASRSLVNGIARAGQGLSEFVEDSERLEKKITSLLKAALQPALLNIKVHYSSEEEVTVNDNLVKQAPFVLPPVQSDSKLTFYAMIRNTDGANGCEKIKAVHITAQSPDGPLSITLPIEPKTCASNKLGKSFIHTLAARVMIRDLEEGKSKLHIQDNKWVSGDAMAIKNEICQLGLQFQLLSKHTSFVTTESVPNPPKEVPNPAPMGLRLFGAKKPQAAFDSFVSQSKLDETIDQLERREALLTAKVAKETQAALNYAKNSKKGALMALKRRKAYSRQLDAISEAKVLLSQQTLSLEAARATRSMRHCNTIDSSMDSIQDNISEHMDISNALSTPLVDFEDDALEAELLELESELESEDDRIFPSKACAPRELDSLEAEMGFGPVATPTLWPDDTKRSTTVQSDRDKMNVFLNAQSSVGSFVFSPNLLSCLGLGDDQVKMYLGGDQQTVWFTAFVVAFFELRLSSLREEWELVLKKANKWLQSQTSNSADTLSQARDIISKRDEKLSSLSSLKDAIKFT